MMLMETQTKKKSKLKLVIIILLVVVIIMGTGIGYFAISGKQVSDVVEKLKPIEEQTVLLKEFLVNLKFDGNKKTYLKVQIALMFTDKKQTEFINLNTSKIRDVIISELRKNSAEEVLDEKELLSLKNEIIKKLNHALGEDIIKDVYFTDLVIQ